MRVASIVAVSEEVDLRFAASRSGMMRLILGQQETRELGDATLHVDVRSRLYFAMRHSMGQSA